jgi:hypothetical protein
MTPKALVLCWPGSAYDSLRGLLAITARQLGVRGVDVVVFTADGEDWPQRLVQILQAESFAFALTMSGVGLDTRVDGALLWDLVRVPLFNWSCDHPCHFPSRHVVQSRYVLHGYVFPDHARFHRDHLGPNGVAFASHLGVPPREIFGTLPDGSAGGRGDGRNGRLLFAKSGADTNAIEATWRGLPPLVSELLFLAAEELLPAQTSAFLPVVQRIAEQRGLFFAGNSAVAMLLLRELDVYVRFRRADQVMRAAMGFPVDVFGSGWEHLPWHGKAARYHGPLAWDRMIERLPAYAGCLSINPLTDESVHDRVFFALAARVPPVSETNLFLRETMPDLAPYTFSYSARAQMGAPMGTPVGTQVGAPVGTQVGDAIERVLADTATAIARTEATWRMVAKPFGLGRSAAQIIQFAAMQGVNCPAGA